MLVTDLAEIFATTLKLSGRSSALKKIIPLVPEASTRRYYRLLLADDALQSGVSSSITQAAPIHSGSLVGVIEAPATAATNMPNVIAVQRFLHERSVAVPEIYFADPTAGVMLQQDLGDLSLNQALKENLQKADLLYQDAIHHMFSWQRLSDDGKCPAFRLSFDVEKLMFEFEFFIRHTLLGYYDAKIADAELSKIRSAFIKIAEELATYPNKVFTHRDYHSRNILLLGKHGRTTWQQYIIDFQDARMGLVQYDLCSLLCDAYAPLTPGQRAGLVDFAFEQGKGIHRQTRGEFEHYWQLSAFQRTVKAMGTFGRQAALGRDDFAAYLKPAMEILREVSIADEALQNLTRWFSEFIQVR